MSGRGKGQRESNLLEVGERGEEEKEEEEDGGELKRREEQGENVKMNGGKGGKTGCE